MSAYVFPTAEYSEDDVSLATVPKAFIPFFRRLWEILQSRDTWYDRESWFRGYQTAAWLEEMLMTATLSDLVESNRQIYRLIDSIFNGAEYLAVGTPPVISPLIPEVPDPQNYVAPGLRRQLRDMQGIINAGWFGIGGEPATLADIVNALRIGSEGKKQSLLDLLSQILGMGSDVASIFGLIEQLFADTVEAGEEGAIIGVLIASTMGNAALMGAQAAQLDQVVSKLDRVITSLDGGGGVPAANVVDELGEIRTLLG